VKKHSNLIEMALIVAIQYCVRTEVAQTGFSKSGRYDDAIFFLLFHGLNSSQNAVNFIAPSIRELLQCPQIQLLG
jgi:hypothetical protein